MKSNRLIVVICVLAILAFLVSILTIWNPFKRNTPIQTASVNGASLAYYTRGQGQPIIFINGFGMTMQDWDPLLLEKLSQNHLLILYDDRGVGDSTGDISQLTEQQQADDVIGLMNTLEIQKADILGWSMGSFIAQLVAEQYPNRVNDLILVSTAPDIAHMKDQPNHPDPDVHGSWETSYVPLMFADQNNEQAYVQRLHTAIQHGEVPTDNPESPAIRAQQEQAMADQTIEAQRYNNLSTITIPTLIIAGQKDTVINTENDSIVANHISNSQLDVIPNAGHAVMFEQPEEFVRIVEGFLKE